MDKVLILEGDADYGASLKSDLDKSHQFQVKVTNTGKDAIEILESMKIAVLVTDLTPPDTDAFELLVYMTQRHPNKPCIIMANRTTHPFKGKVEQREFFSILEKPFEVGELLSAIFVALNLRDEGMNFQGMNMASIVPLIEVLKKTCYLEIKSNDTGIGYLCYKNGDLVAAYSGDLKGKAAGDEIISWKSIVIKIMERSEWKKTLVDQNLVEKTETNGDESKKEPATGLPTKEHISNVFNKKIKDFKDITGFMALAILKQEDDEVIASHQIEPDLDMVHIAGEMKSLFSVAEDSFKTLKLGTGNAFTFHMEKSTFLIVSAFSQSDSGLYMIGVTKQYGNWTYFKTLMRKLIVEINK